MHNFLIFDQERWREAAFSKLKSCVVVRQPEDNRDRPRYSKYQSSSPLSIDKLRCTDADIESFVLHICTSKKRNMAIRGSVLSSRVPQASTVNRPTLNPQSGVLNRQFNSIEVLQCSIHFPIEGNCGIFLSPAPPAAASNMYFIGGVGFRCS